MKKRKAFTLVELLVVIAILGVLAGLLVPAIYAVVGKKKEPSINHMPTPVVTQSVMDKPQAKGGEAIPVTLHGMKYTIIYNGPDDVEIYRQKECEDATLGSTDRTAAEK